MQIYLCSRWLFFFFSFPLFTGGFSILAGNTPQETFGSFCPVGSS